MANEKLRRMISEPTEATYSDEVLEEYVDDEGSEAGAAGAIWAEKAAALQETAYSVTADGAKYELQQKIEHALKLSAYYNSRKPAVTNRLTKFPVEDSYDVYEDWQYGEPL